MTNKATEEQLRREQNDMRGLIEALADICAGFRARRAYRAWLRDPSLGVPYKQVRQEMGMEETECHLRQE